MEIMKGHTTDIHFLENQQRIRDKIPETHNINFSMLYWFKFKYFSHITTCLKSPKFSFGMCNLNRIFGLIHKNETINSWK
jgi:hypothetical protein